MVTESDVSGHYSSGGLLQRLSDALRDDGVDPDRPTISDLAPYDQFHGRGLEATEEMAGAMDIGPGDHILDVGSGIGGPARYFSDRFGCTITGIDLTEEFCQAARYLTRIIGLDDTVTYEHGNALAMPFADATFDGAYSMNVSMNIADKPAFYAEIHRVLKPGAWLMLSEIAQGEGGPIDFPTPWARTADTSFLSTPRDTATGLEAAGFTIVQLRDTSEQAMAFGARAKAMVERGEKPPHRAVRLIHGELAPQATANVSKAAEDASILPIEILCGKPR